MSKPIKYYCCICHKEVPNYDTIRLARMEYGAGKCGGHYKVEHHDFCPLCYAKYYRWLKKHEVKKDVN